jgi:CheY-like chemotaxis protein
MIAQAILAYLDDGVRPPYALAAVSPQDGFLREERLTADYGPLMETMRRQAVGQVAPVLVVDDEPGMLRAMVRILRRRGYRTVAAADGKAALELCRQCRPRMVFLDLSMPHCNGAQVLKELRSRLGDETPPVVIVTGSIASEHLTSLGGAVAVVDKPFRNEQIVALAERYAPEPLQLYDVDRRA